MISVINNMTKQCLYSELLVRCGSTNWILKTRIFINLPTCFCNKSDNKWMKAILLLHFTYYITFTHLPLVLHICISESGQHWFRTSDNGLVPIWRQAIIWTNAGLCQLHPKKQTWMKFYSKYKSADSRKCNWKCHLWNGPLTRYVHLRMRRECR